MAVLLLGVLASGAAAQNGPPVTFTGVTLIDCHDGDTCDFLVPLEGPAAALSWVKVRLRGIDAPELRGSTLDAARTARDALLSLLRSATRIDLVDFAHYRGGFNRDLATVTADGVDVAAVLIAEGLAVPYVPD